MPDSTNLFTLGIEMSNPSASAPGDEPSHAVAIWDASDALVGSAALSDVSRGSDSVMHAVSVLARAHRVEPRSIRRIIVSVGPGGYTALRIATTSAKILADTLGAQLVAVPTHRVASVSIGPDACPAMITLASKKDRCHASHLAVDRTLAELGIVDASVLETQEFRSIVADHHLPGSFHERIVALGLDIVPLRLDARDLLRASEGIEPIDPLRCAPIYAREPDAVTQWRSRGSV